MENAASLKKPISKPSPTMYNILFIIGLCHLLNDSIQSVIPAMFPILEKTMGLTFTQLGFIAFTLNMVSSVLQPVVGWYTDKRPMPYALPIGLTSSLAGIVGLSFAPSFSLILLSVFFIGLGSAVFHPEGSRVAYLAAGERRGLAQSIYQVGGNTGSSSAPLITALILVPFGQFGAIWFTIAAALAVMFLIYIANWYTLKLSAIRKEEKKNGKIKKEVKLTKAIYSALAVIVFLVFARSWYGSAISNFYTFYVIEKYHLSIAQSQVYIFIFLVMGALGTFAGGPLADRYGKRTIILYSLLATAPFALILPFAGPIAAYPLIAAIGFILSSSFSVTVVYAQELIPGKIGTMSGLTVGLAFGMGAIGSVALGSLIDAFGITAVMTGIALLPILGTLAYLLPADQTLKEWQQ
ncbi:MFS transporter [Metabacillus idriensis]|uniref:MFS transporter n=1 Tax=Metabacillus idriensis TaxID=324768 RepID=UPI00203F7A6F|nr:MFS transporter [Metabacillus idriensis]MCM3595836.1 MFS transporter [Metabacillus idriensis]